MTVATPSCINGWSSTLKIRILTASAIHCSHPSKNPVYSLSLLRPVVVQFIIWLGCLHKGGIQLPSNHARDGTLETARIKEGRFRPGRSVRPAREEIRKSRRNR